MKLPNNSLQITSPPPLPAGLLFGQSESQRPLSIRFEELLHADDQSTVITHAVQVHHHAGAMKANAMGICVELYRCREAYGRGATRAKSAKNGWGAFCTANFSALNLSEGNIRAAVRSGEILDRLLQAEPESASMFSRLSRAALFALGDSPDVVAEVKQILLENPESAVTAAEIKDLKQTLRSQSDSISAMQAELQQASKQVVSLQNISADVNGMLVERESQVVGLIAANEQLKKAAKTPVESLVPTLPNGVKTEADLLNQLNASISEKQGELSKVVLKVRAETEKLAGVQTRLAGHTQSAGTLHELQGDVFTLISKYPELLFKRTGQTSPIVEEAMSEIANKLRTLADLIQPAGAVRK